MAASLRRNHFSNIPMGIITVRLRYTCIVFLLALSCTAAAQTDSIPVFKDAIAASRSKTYNNIVKNIITKNLSLPLSDSTEENWQDAFYAMEVLQYKQPWLLQKVKTAFDGVEKRSTGFQRALLELVYTNYKTEFDKEVNRLLLSATSNKVFAMCAEYKLSKDISVHAQNEIIRLVNPKLHKAPNKADDIILDQLMISMAERELKNFDKVKKLLPLLLSNSGFNGHTVVYSIQRKNRDYPGIAIVRDSTGKFVTDPLGNISSVPQLARSITNLPGYLTNGNTPQGIFRMNGFAVSKSGAIGPTENIQLMMPCETSPQYFLNDSTITDTAWTSQLYERLLPADCKYYAPFYNAYYASAIGRTEIIAHGTTVDPVYYKGQPYYPHTPTQGCLCTKEIWSDVNGRRSISDQQQLVDAVKKAGGANGYCVVIEIDDQQKPVSIEDILPYIKAGGR